MPHTCTKCGNLDPFDVVENFDYDRPSGTTLEYRTCGNCGSMVRRC